VIVIPLVGAIAASPAWLPGAGIDHWIFPEALSASANAERDATAIATIQEEVFRSIETVDHIVERLIDGKITLAMAADGIVPLLEARPRFGDTWRHLWPGTTPRHSAARHAMQRAAKLLWHDPSRQAEVTLRLEEEYRAM
jgi:hypothetical protein